MSICGNCLHLGDIIQETAFVTGDMYSRGSAPGPAASAPAGPTAPGGSAAGQQKSSDYGTGYGSYSGYQVTQGGFVTYSCSVCIR